MIRSQSALYDLGDNPSRAIIGENLLANPGFEKLLDNRPVEWMVQGNPQVDRSGAKCLSRQVAAYVASQTDVFYISPQSTERVWFDDAFFAEVSFRKAQ
jgi:hypothetical protein